MRLHIASQDRSVALRMRCLSPSTSSGEPWRRPPERSRRVDEVQNRAAGTGSARQRLGWRCARRTTVTALIRNVKATDRTLSPAKMRATARSRKSIEQGLVIAAGLQNPVSSLNQKIGPSGIPNDSFECHPALNARLQKDADPERFSARAVDSRSKGRMPV